MGTGKDLGILQLTTLNVLAQLQASYLLMEDHLDQEKVSMLRRQIDQPRQSSINSVHILLFFQSKVGASNLADQQIDGEVVPCV